MTGVGVVRCLAALVVAWSVGAIALAGAVQAQGQDDLARLRAEISQLQGQGKYAQALPVAQRYVELARQKHGEEHPEFMASISWLASIYQGQGRLADAEPLYRRSLAIAGKTLGLEHPAVAVPLNNLAELYRAQGRLAEAEPLYRRSLVINEKTLGPEHPNVGTSLNNLALLYLAQGRLAEAEPLFKRSLAVSERALGPEHLNVAATLGSLALVYRDQGRLAEAEPLHRRSLAIGEKTLGPEHPTVGTALHHLALVYLAQGRLAEAEPLFKRSLAILGKALGPEHPNVAATLGSLARLYQAHGRLAEAEPLFERSLAILEKTLGPDHTQVATVLTNLASLYRAQGRLAEAELLNKRSLAIFEKTMGREHPHVAKALNDLAEVHEAQARYGEAEPLFKRSLAILEKALGHEHPEVATALNSLANLHKVQGRYREAEPLYERSLAIREKVLGPEDPYVPRSLLGLADVYRSQGRYADADPLYKRGLAILEKTLGRDHAGVGVALNNLGELYWQQGRYAEAEPLLKRSIAIHEARGHHNVGAPLLNLATLYWTQRRYAEAEPLLKRSLATLEKALGHEHPGIATALNNLASLYLTQGRHIESEALYKRSLALSETAHGREHPNVAVPLNNLGDIYAAQRRYAEAERLYERSLSIFETTMGREHPLVATALNSLARLAIDQSDWARAADYGRRSTAIIKRRAERGLSGAAEASFKDETQLSRSYFEGLVRAIHRMEAGARGSGPVAAEAFETAQWALGSEAAESLAQMAARSATGSPELASLVRERQDLVREAQIKDKQLTAAKSQEPTKRDAAAEKALADRLAAIEVRLGEINEHLAKGFPDYAALASPAPISVADVQAQLGAGETLVLFLDTSEWRPLPEETFVWVVTRSQVRWVRAELGAEALKREVAALRCGLDNALWDDKERHARCVALLGAPRDDGRTNVLPFPVARAHALYKALFREVEDLIAGKHLLIVPSGALTQLPFQVLVTEAPPLSRQEHRAVAWLARAHAVTILPSVSSLKALRRVGRPSAAPRPMIGFGNPLLDGPNAGYAEPARLAREKQRCLQVDPQWRVVVRVAALGGVAPVATRAALADVAHLKMQVPLPETAGELCAVARDLKAESSEMRLGARATEAEVKRLSAGGELAKYRVLHFATHGAMAGELNSTREPGLILTPPSKASAQDDGYLSASEIAALKLDADWVILSACNTAAGAATSAEALSGLARAFIYAGARALLVSHWAVNSDATVKLVTTAVGQMGRDPRVGRAEAMRRAMLALIDKGRPEEAHPAYWAPFIVVGEGAPVR